MNRASFNTAGEHYRWRAFRRVWRWYQWYYKTKGAFF